MGLSYARRKQVVGKQWSGAEQGEVSAEQGVANGDRG